MRSHDFLKLVNQFSIQHSDLDDIHGYYHTKRVYKICVKLGKKFSANLKILKIASLLHDIGRKYESSDAEGRNHAEISARLALQFLKTDGLGLSKSEIENILHSIRAHSYSNKVEPNTLEAKILQDADKLDAIGAVGLYRTIAYTTSTGGKIEQVINHIKSKIVKIYEMLWLDYSKELAERRQKLTLDFYNAIKSELM